MKEKDGTPMVNILLEGYDIDASWFYEELKNHISPTLLNSFLIYIIKTSKANHFIQRMNLAALGVGNCGQRTFSVKKTTRVNANNP